jgi:arabinofuranan 3-O-arabinosyltransferase
VHPEHEAGAVRVAVGLDADLGDLVGVDGAPLALDITDEVLDRLLAGEAVDVDPCDDARLSLSAGTHRIVTGAGIDAASTTGIDVDRITLRSSYFWHDNLPAPPVVQVERTRTTRTATVGPCPEGRWLVLGEGYNDAWTASATVGNTDTSLGAPEQVSGGFNGWYLAPSDQTRTVTMTWTPQSSLNIALLIAALGVLACLLLALVDRRSARPVDEFDPPAWCPIGTRASTSDAATAAVALVVAAALVVRPHWAVIALVPAALVVVTRRPRLAAWAAAALAAALGAGVLMTQRHHRYFPDAAWPGYFEGFHEAGLFVVVLLFAATLGSDDRADGRQRRIRVRRGT